MNEEWIYVQWVNPSPVGVPPTIAVQNPNSRKLWKEEKIKTINGVETTQSLISSAISESHFGWVREDGDGVHFYTKKVD